MSRNELEDAERMIRRALSIFENAFGRTHESVGMTLNNLGDLFIDLGRNDEAVEIASEALDILRTVFGSNHPDVAYPLATLGDAHLAAGRTDKARDFYRQGVAVRTGSVTAARFDPVLFYLLVELEHSRLELGDSTGAAQSLQDALTLWNRTPESADPRLAASLHYLGRWLAEQGRCAEAAPLLRQAAELPTRGRRPDEVEKLLASCSEGSYEADIVL